MVFKHLVQGLKGLVLGRQRALPGLEDRRQLVRMRCDYPVIVKLGEAMFAARVTDISSQGLRLVVPEVERPPRKDSLVLVSYRPGGVPTGRQRLRCRVIWTRRQRNRALVEFGLAYDDNQENLKFSWAQVLLQELGFDDRRLYRRRALRVDLQLPVVLRPLEGGADRPGELLNLGVGGLLCRTAEELSPGTLVRVSLGPYRKLPALAINGRVVSNRPDPDGVGDRHGIRFLGYETPEIKLLGSYVIETLRERYA